jgi:hypothetical protein
VPATLPWWRVCVCVCVVCAFLPQLSLTQQLLYAVRSLACVLIFRCLFLCERQEFGTHPHKTVLPLSYNQFLSSRVSVFTALVIIREEVMFGFL